MPLLHRMPLVLFLFLSFNQNKTNYTHLSYVGQYLSRSTCCDANKRTQVLHYMSVSPVRVWQNVSSKMCNRHKVGQCSTGIWS
jgi:hypothetical protein